jgi:hypothetical protein
MYGPKMVQKGVPSGMRNPKSPVKQANCAKSFGQKGVKNRAQKVDQKSRRNIPKNIPQKSTKIHPKRRKVPVNA